MLWTDINLLWENPKKQYGKMFKWQTPTDGGNSTLGEKSNLQLVVEQNFPPEKWLYNRSSPGESLL